MKIYVLLMARDILTGEPEFRCRSDINKHASFNRIGNYVTYDNGDGTKKLYIVMYEGTEEVCKKFKESLLKTYSVADLEMYGGELLL